MLFNANSSIFQAYHGENKLIFNEMMTSSAAYKYYTNTLSWIFIVLAHWNNRESADRHVAPVGHIIPIPSRPGLCSFSLMLHA